MSFDDELDKYLKSSNFKNKVDHLIRTDKNFARNGTSEGTESRAKFYGEEMKDILHNEILAVKGAYSGESFLDYIDYAIEFISGEGWIVNVSFDENKVHRSSLWESQYPDGVYLPDIYNNGMNAKNVVYGEWHGSVIKSNRFREAHHFIQNAAAIFRKKHKDVIVHYNPRYGD